MGQVNFGIPIEAALFIKKIMNLENFIEGGTFKGGTAKKMAGYFRNVITIEASPKLYKAASESLANINNIIIKEGNTKEILAATLNNGWDNALFWLDSHWSGGETYGINDECPLIKEIEIINNSKMKNMAIMIDDARLFLSPPPKPHNLEKWPSIKEISLIMPQYMDIVVFNDVIFLLPKDIIINFKKYIQDQVTAEWNKKESLFSQVVSLLKIAKGKLKNVIFHS